MKKKGAAASNFSRCDIVHKTLQLVCNLHRCPVSRVQSRIQNHIPGLGYTNTVIQVISAKCHNQNQILIHDTSP